MESDILFTNTALYIRLRQASAKFKQTDLDALLI